MSFDIWFRDGIENILLAIDEANRDVVSRFDSPEVRIYRQGFAAAIGAVALAFGIPPRIFGGRAAGAEDKVHVFNMPFAVLDDE